MDNNTDDKWKILLQEQIIALEKCQEEHNLNSCMRCEKLLDCTIRDRYIKSVYESMSKGSGGGFEF